ncbi:MAG TPA: hypothetical protein VND87_18055 [Stellaceae bacterium]|nr:hypothetical protein [Stellaceae bacterium]
MKSGKGLYRVHGKDGRPDDVRIDLGGITAPLEESLYRARGYRPPVDELPWFDKYVAPHE